MRKIRMTLLTLLLALVPLASAHGQAAQQSLAFNANRISGFPTGAVFLTGGGAYNLERKFLKTGGGFRCEAPDLPGIQNVWIEGVGCGTAIVNL